MYKNFLPDEYVKDIFQISPEALKEKGIKGIITDLDNTLVEWDRPEATPEIKEWVRMMQEAGLQVTILSNNNQSRVELFCDPLGTPFICDARKPLARNFKKALETMGLKKNEVVMVGDQLMTDILGGNRFGLYTILVVPVASSDGFVTKFNRMIERRIMAKLKSQGKIKWEE
ncbi:YqeG family HAD IIIA-type phosphatase [Sporosarcina sp. ACRSL]|uniref:YqeG family HAD IIIA-type phosphatase n=1 Tax=Sporosarcina sp. ACRSL TaxID=2918215 RepID=UPI001EF6706E|nr:YqeG family HAD IIIA-type phosphatase [Sporosarcina sp. ACRSL]MCG7345065.1 YqeG family HAD IIIA-type phosphatase [Sporosarcina sp. ACRSL]